MPGYRKKGRLCPAVASGQAALLLLAAISLAGMDQLLKYLVKGFPEGSVIFSLPPLLDVVHTANTGAAFSLLSGETLLLLLMTTLMLAALLGYMIFSTSLTGASRMAFAVLLGGGIGNWLDRFHAGSVTDYIRLSFIRFPVFNFADVCITLAVAGLMLLLFTNRFEKRSGENHGSAH